MIYVYQSALTCQARHMRQTRVAQRLTRVFEQGLDSKVCYKRKSLRVDVFVERPTLCHGVLISVPMMLEVSVSE